MGFANARAMQKLPGELHPDTGLAGARSLERGAQITQTIAALYGQGKHRARHDHRLVQTGKGQAQRPGRIGQRVGPVGDDNPVTGCACVIDTLSDPDPIGRRGLGAVNQRFERLDRDICSCVARSNQALHGLFNNTRHWGEALCCLGHADRAAGVDQEYAHRNFPDVVSQQMPKGLRYPSASTQAMQGRTGREKTCLRK